VETVIKRLLVLILILICIVFISGCTEEPTGEVTKIDEVTTALPTTASIQTTIVQPTAKTYKIGDVLSNDKIEFIVHSARKTYYISDFAELKTGFMYLIVDFSIKNLNYEDGYNFNPNDVEVEDNNHYTYTYSWDSSSLSKYFDMTIIELSRTKRGELAFEVPKDADEFTFILKSSIWGKSLVYVNLGNIPNPPETKSVNLEIDSVNYNWYDYGMVIEGKTGTGAIYSVSLAVENAGNLPLIPLYDMKITHDGSTIFSKSDQSGLLFSSIPPGNKESDTISLLMVNIDEPGTYDIEVKVKEKGETTVLDMATKEINVG
jgi:hypothetical protein